jgi:hypothetical protein
VRVSVTRPDGFLPVYSCDTKEEADALVVATCSRGADGHYYSNELAREQSLEMLEQFSQKLERVDTMRQQTPR